DRRARGALLRTGTAPGRHLRRFHRAGPPDAVRRDAHPAPADGAGEGTEGTREDAHSHGVLHFPGAVRRGDRPRHHQHPQLFLTSVLVAPVGPSAAPAGSAGETITRPGGHGRQAGGVKARLTVEAAVVAVLGVVGFRVGARPVPDNSMLTPVPPG